MTFSATYDDTDALGRVQLVFSGYSVNADYATVERSLDQITWTTVRGGDTTALTAGAGHLDDYEYQAGQLNHYRVSAIDAAAVLPITNVNAAVGVNVSLVPPLPVGVAAGDLMVLFASIRNSGTGTVNLPAGWTNISGSGTNFRVMARMWQSGDTAPTVTFSGGAANQDVIATIQTLRGADLTNFIAVTPLLNSSAQDILTPSVTYAQTDVTVRAGWKQDDNTGTTPPGGYTLLSSLAVTTGDDSSMVSCTKVWTAAGAGTDPASVILETGGTPAISRGHSVTFHKAPYTDRETTTVTPVMATWRLKNPSRPALNTKIEVTNIPEISRRARTGTFDVLGRTLPVAVTDVQSGRLFQLELHVQGYSAMLDMDNRLATGEPMFLQAPSLSNPVPTLYFVATGSGSVREDTLLSQSYTFVIPAIEVAKPGSTVYGDTYIWNDVVTTYATWTDVLAAVTTWSNLIDKISTSSVIVP